jgi:peptide/nickel transport system permease protein
MLVTAIAAPVLEPHNPLETNVLKRHVPPAWYAKGSPTHVLGTDAVGRDVLSRIIRGTRITVIVVVTAVTTGIIFGTTLGLVAGYFGGWLDEIIMRIVDGWAIMPQLLIILVLVLVFGQSMGLLIGVLAMLSWPGAVRLVRAQTLSLRIRDYVALARVAGASDVRILYRHILPGVVNIVMVSATLGTGTIILTEATLSFLGAGIPPPNPSWGLMVSDGREYLRQAWWAPFFPGKAILLVVMAGNFLGDWMRDRFDPRLRQL